MTIINGANNHSVEDILASIRSSIAEELGPARFVAGEIQMPAYSATRREAQHAEEVSEFELPAIFKPGYHPAPEKPRLLGRLSDALKSTAPDEQGRLRTVIPFDPSAGGRIVDAQPQSQSPATAAAFRPVNTTPPAAAPATDDGEVKRIMPSFFDTRVAKLGELTRQAYEPPKPVEPAPQPVPHTPVHRQPPTLPGGSLVQHTTEAIDDAAAQLLRPMLRQWLQENMPKIVEKALLSEAQGDPPGKPRR